MATSSTRIMATCTIGTFLEFFDYTLYGYFAQTIGSLFFPHHSPAMQLIAAWGIFAVGFIVRPIGAIIFGHIADRIGRSRVLPYTTLLMALPTACIGLLPTYSNIGIMAPVLLLICRMLQGFAVSAEYNGTSIYILENKWKKPGLLTAFTPFACGMGMLTASLLAYVFSLLSTSLHEWYWRAPFMIAGTVIGAVGFYMRRTLQETESFIALQKTQKIVKQPLLQAVKTHKLALLTNIACSAYMVSTSYLLLVYMTTFMQQQFQLTLTTALIVSSLAVLLESSACLFFGWLSDFCGRAKMLFISSSTMVVAIASMVMQPDMTLPQFLMYTALFLIILSAFDGPLTLYLSKLFTTEIRYSATTVGYNIGGAVFGGLAPLIMSVILEYVSIPPTTVLGFYIAFWAMMASTLIIIHKRFCSPGELCEPRKPSLRKLTKAH